MHKIEKKDSIDIIAFAYENKEKHPTQVSKKRCEEKHAGLLLTEKKGDRHYFSIKDFNTSAYNHTLHRGKKPFCHYCLKAFSTEEIFKLYIKDCLKTSSKERIILSKKDESVNLKMMKEKKSHHL